jgi:Domain of unknown function DUF11
MRRSASRSRLVWLAVAAAAAATLWSPSSGTATAVKPAGLRLAFTGLPRETRPGGSMTYSLTATNVGRSRATAVDVRVYGVSGDASVLAVVSSSDLSCSHRDEFSVDCSITAIAPRAQASVEISARATRLGTIRVAASALWHVGARVRERRAGISTAVLTPDSVHAVASRLIGGNAQSPQQLTLDAISAPHGQDPAGTFTLKSHWADVGFDEEVSGRVTCLNVAGNVAVVGVMIDNANSNIPPQPDSTPVTHLLFLLVDNGFPGAGRDTMTFGGGGDPWDSPCQWFGGAPGTGFPLSDGDIVGSHRL